MGKEPLPPSPLPAAERGGAGEEESPPRSGEGERTEATQSQAKHFALFAPLSASGRGLGGEGLLPTVSVEGEEGTGMTGVHEVSIRFHPPLRGAVRAGPIAAPAAAALSACCLRPKSGQPPIEAQAETEQMALQAALAGLRNAATQFGSQSKSMLMEMRQAAVELAIAVAGRLLHDSARAGEFPLEAVIRDVVERLPIRRDAIVSMNPEDLGLAAATTWGTSRCSPMRPPCSSGPTPACTADACRAEASGVTRPLGSGSGIGRLMRQGIAGERCLCST